MKRSTKWLGLAAAGLILAGCAVGPQRSPAPSAVPGPTTSSTTGDLDACAIALGNMPAGVTGAAAGVGPALGTPPGTMRTPGTAAAPRTDAVPKTTGTTGVTGTTPMGTPGAAGGRVEVTANGVLLGNVALVALPDQDNMPTSPTAPVPGLPGATTPGTTAAPGTAVAPGGNVAGAPTAPPAGTAPGRAVTPGTITPGVANNPTAIDRIRAACERVVEIRVVDGDADKRRMGEIAMAIRKGTPITSFMSDIVAMNGRANVVWSGMMGGTAPAGTPAPPASPGAAAPARRP